MKQRLLLLIPLILLISVLSVNALDVELISPNSPAWIPDSQVTFKCQIDPEGIPADTARLYTDITGTWSQTGSIFNNPNPTETFNATFTVQGIENGNYEWNCLSNGQFASSNFSFTIEVPENLPPYQTSQIPDQTWNQETSKNNAFDLDDYFTDPEDETITYSVLDPVSNIIIDISSGQVSFSQPSGWFGYEEVTFLACAPSTKCEDSNTITLTVNQVNQDNDPPTISGVPDQTKEIDDNDWTIDLNQYIDDDEDSDDDLTISVSGVDTTTFTVSIDQDDNELTFHIEDEGSDTFTITVEDTDGATDETTVEVSIVEELEEEDEFTDYGFDEFTIEIITTTPAFNNIKIKPGESKKFEIDINEDGNIIWYVNNIRKQTGLKTFTYKPTSIDIGSHIIKVIVSSDFNEKDKDSKIWNIEVIKSSDLCGNNKIDTNETCLTCPEDIPCQEGEYCDEGICKTKQLNKITGFFIKTKDFALEKWYYPTLILGLILLLIITIKIISMQKKPQKDEFLAEFSEKISLKERIRAKLRAWDRKRQLKKTNKENLNRLKTEKKEHISATAPGIESIISFINQGLNEGNSNKEIKRALKEKGWNIWQIRKAFKKINNDSRKPT